MQGGFLPVRGRKCSLHGSIFQGQEEVSIEGTSWTPNGMRQAIPLHHQPGSSRKAASRDNHVMILFSNHSIYVSPPIRGFQNWGMVQSRSYPVLKQAVAMQLFSAIVF
jgi:hypothetical protein